MPHPESGETPALLYLTSSSLYLCPPSEFSFYPPILPPSLPPSPKSSLTLTGRNKRLPGTCKLLTTSHPSTFTLSHLHTLPPSHPPTFTLSLFTCPPSFTPSHLNLHTPIHPLSFTNTHPPSSHPPPPTLTLLESRYHRGKPDKRLVSAGRRNME